MVETKRNSAGGAATNKGIWYQAVWVVLQALRSRLRMATEASGHSDDVRLVLEPSGGDVRIEYLDTIRVVQLKIKSHGTWSLQQVIDEVFPDLLRAVNPKEVRATYEFVTEGRRGQWQSALTFFNGLGETPALDAIDAAYERLDATREVAGIRGSHAWPTQDRTQRGLFDRVLRALAGDRKLDAAALRDLRRRVWHLLARFRFSGGHTPDAVRLEVEDGIRAVASNREDVPALVRQMAGWIAEHSSENGTVVSPAQLLEVHGLERVVPLSDLLSIRRRCREELAYQLDRVRYRKEWDVRRPKSGTPDLSVNVVTGGSGEGKSWAIYSAADAAATLAVVLVESSGDAQDDLAVAATRVWQTVIGHDKEKPLENIASHLHEVLGVARGDPWLTLCIDRVRSADAAERLNAAGLERHGIRLILGCELEAADQLAELGRQRPDRVSIHRLGPFGEQDLHDYLGRRLGDAFAEVPADVRDVLRNPQRAAIYCDLASGAEGEPEHGRPKEWHPTTEYELVDEFWRRIAPPSGPGRLDAARLQALAAGLMDGRPYPWTFAQIAATNVDDDQLERLTSRGWLRGVGQDDRVEIAHDRLLAYAVARAVVERARAAGEAAAATIAAALKTLEAGPTGNRLGYLRMDVIHLLLRDHADLPVALALIELVAADGDHHDREVLHLELLPTLGQRAVPLLLQRLRATANRDSTYEVKPIVEGLAAALERAEDAAVIDTLTLLMEDSRPEVRRAGVQLFRRVPMPELAKRVWQLHLDMQRDPASYADGEVAKHLLRDDSFAALAAVVADAPDWARRAVGAIASGDPAADDLAWLIARARDRGALWRSCKTQLLEKIPFDKTRSLSRNIALWHDHDELHRLEAWATRPEDAGEYGGQAAAVAALSELDVQRAVRLLTSVSPSTLGFQHGSYLPRLFLLAGDQVRDALLSRLTSTNEPVPVASAFGGHEHEMDGRIVSFLLDLLAGLLVEADDDANVDTGKTHRSVRLILEPLARASRSDALVAFADCAGTPLAERLTRYVGDVVGPRMHGSSDGRCRGPAFAVLLRIGGEAYSRALQLHLASDSTFGRFDAAEWAQRYADEPLRAALLESVLRPAEGGLPIEMIGHETAHALAAGSDLYRLSQVAQKLGGNFPDVRNWLPAGAATGEDVVSSLTSGVDATDRSVAHGSLLMLSHVRPEVAAEKATSLLERSENLADRAVAIAALWRSRAGDERSVAALAGFLRNAELRQRAINAIAACGEVGKKRLAESLSEVWDDELAVFLAEASPGDPLVLRLAERMSDGRFDKLLPNPYSAVLSANDDELRRVVLARCNAAVHDRLHADAFDDQGRRIWAIFVGSRRDAIRGLAVIDPHAGFLAAGSALREVGGRDRHLYPSVLYRLDAVGARRLFADLSPTEADRRVIFAMAQELGTPADAHWLVELLTGEDAARRLASCRLAVGPCGTDAEVQRALFAALQDLDHDVRDAAEQTLRRNDRESRALELIDAASGIAEPERVAAYIDAAVAVGPPGYQKVKAPAWIRRMQRHELLATLPALKHWAIDRYVAAQKSATDNAEQIAKNALRS